MIFDYDKSIYTILKPVLRNAGLTISYRRDIYSLIKSISDELKRNLKSYDGLLSIAAATKIINDVFKNHNDNKKYIYIATAFVTAYNLYHLRKHDLSIKNTHANMLSIKVKNKGIDKEISKKIDENVSLIKSIPEKFHSEIKDLIIDNFIDGEVDKEKLISDIKKRYRVSNSRASLIADDQSNKMISILSEIRNRNIGCDGYYWGGMLDNRERHTHVVLEGDFILYSNPPSIGHAGTPIRCRCLQYARMRIVPANHIAK